MSRIGKKRLILPLVLLLSAVIAALTVYYLVNQRLSVPITVENIDVDSKAALKLNALEQISKKNGVTEWKLKASSASLLKDQNKAVLEDVDVIFFTEQNTQVHLTAEKGELNTKTHDMVFNRNVIVRYEGSTLTSETLHYAKKAHIIRSDSRVRVNDGFSTIEADTMEVRLNRNQIILTGHVKGQFSENSQPAGF